METLLRSGEACSEGMRNDSFITIAFSCHRERSAMCPLGMAISPESCHRERSAAISVFYRWRTEKREIASQARNDSRRASGARRSLLSPVIASKAWRSRFYRAGKPKGEIASQARNDSRRASAAWRSRLSSVGKQRKERLLRTSQ